MLTEKQILTLSALHKIGKKTIFTIGESITTVLSDPEFKHFIVNWAEQNNLKHITNSEYDIGLHKAETVLENSEKGHINIYSYWNAKFPSNLKIIKQPPVLVHVVGDVNILNEKKIVAIIGTREPSPYGFRTGRRLAQIFAQEGFVVVSGLAKGSDTAGHRGCLDKKGRTVAVLAHGLDMIYPKVNQSLAHEIVQSGGALLSEYSIGQKPFGPLFVERDRLQSGLSNGTIVIETDILGGTMHTVKFTEEEKKPLACINHPIEKSDYSKVNGNKMLIAEKRAAPIGTAEDIESFISRIYERIGIAKNTASMLHDNIGFSKTLFDIDELVTNNIDGVTEEAIKKKRKKKVKSLDTSYQGIIWESSSI